MYCKTGKNIDVDWVFCKTLAMSENYQRFKDGYLDCADLLFGLYTKKESEPVELFEFRKKVNNVKFITESQVNENGMVSEARQTLHRKIVR